MHQSAQTPALAQLLALPELSNLDLARLARLSYSNPWIIRAQAPGLVDAYDYYGDYACPTCQRRVHLDAQAQLYRRPGEHLVLVFRGSDSPIDWLANLDCRPCHHYGMPLHAGFLHGYQALRQRLLEDMGQPASITVTGHSKGGGEAVPAAYDLYLHFDGLVPVRMVTFGAPRVAQRRYRRAFDAVIPSMRIVNGPDPVPWVAPCTLGYRHVGRLRQLRLAWRTLGALTWMKRRSLFKRYHGIDAYIDTMEGAAHA